MLKKMLFRVVAPSLALGFLFLNTACYDIGGNRGYGDILTETRDVQDFHALEIGCNGTVKVQTDSVFKVEVSCEESIIAYLETVEEGGVLKIHFDRNVYDVDGLKIIVSAPNWDGFEIAGSADVDVNDLISGDELRLDISGSGNLDVNELDFAEVNASVTGSGDVFLKGLADELRFSVSGSGDLDALDCPVKDADINVSGSGSARVDASNTLKVSISGSGTVEYKGDPAVLDVNISGSGHLRKI